MFTIADTRHFVPSYLSKVLSNGMGLISVSITDAMLFKAKTEAKDFLSKVKDCGDFEFKVHELVIKA